MKIKFVNMPFAGLMLPSLGLSQLQSVLRERFANQVDCNILYLNHGFAQYFGIEEYQRIALSSEGINTGVGDWFFRKAAFPNLPDNAEVYFQRYYPERIPGNVEIRNHLLKKRARLIPFLDSLIEREKLDEADIVGFTSMFVQNVASLALAKRIKQKNPKVVIIMGGCNCEHPMGATLLANSPQLDYIFSGPSLKSLPEFVGHIMAENRESIKEIPGILGREWSPSNSVKTCSGLERDIDSVVEVDYTDFLKLFPHFYPAHEVKPMLLFETSRGCWWGAKAQCTFCGLNGGNIGYRFMSCENAGKIFSRIFSYKESCSEVQMVDNIIPPEFIDNLLPSLNTPENMNIFYEVRANLTKENLKTLKKARVNLIQPGVESLQTKQLQRMRKGLSAFQNIRFLKDCVSTDVFPTWNILLGFPGDDDELYERYKRIIPSVFHLVPPSNAFSVRFDRYSLYFNESEKFRLQLEPFEYYEMIYPFKKEEISDLAYFFYNTNVSCDYILPLSRGLAPVQQAVKDWKTAWGRKIPPMLYFEGSDGVIDTRNGMKVRIPLSSEMMNTLETCETEQRISDLLDKSTTRDVIDYLLAQKMLFEEDGRVLSLVFKEKPESLSTIISGMST